MASTFHTPSFGDEDFNLPSLTLPPTEGSTDLYPAPTSNYSSNPQNVTALSTPSQGHLVQGQNFSPTFQQNDYHGYPQHNHGYSFLPKFPPQTFDIPDIQFTNSLSGGHGVQGHHTGDNLKGMNIVATTVMATSQAMLIGMAHNSEGQQMLSPAGQGAPGHVTSQVSPPGSNTTSPGRESSAEESSSDDSVPLAQLAQKRNAPAPTKPKAPAQPAPKKPRTPKKRKKKDPNEPQKPVSAYALFFRDTQAAIKTRNPNASFGEVSKIVASMWDGLAEDHKNDYKKRTETAKKEYLKQLAAYRATLVSTGALESGDGAPATNTTAKHQTRSSPANHPPMPTPAMTTVPMTTHPMTTSISMPHMSGMPLSHMPTGGHGNGMVHNPGHMMGPPPHHYGMMPSAGHMGGASSHLPMHSRPGGLSPNTMVASPPEAMGMHDGYMGAQVLPGSPPMAMDSPTASMCVRNGCGNPAIQSRGWDNEYCSNDCVVNHCRDAFTQWVASRQGSSPYASVK